MLSKFIQRRIQLGPWRPRASRYREAGAAPDIPILLYHHLVEDDEPDPGAYEISLRQFEQQLDLLQQWGFAVVTLAYLLRITEGLEKRARRMVVITFDDGFRSFHSLALPALLRRGLTATVFVPAGEIGGTNRWDISCGRPERQVMDETELREIAAAGMEVGSHGWAHRRLTECSAEEAQEETHRSRERLQELRLQPDFFAYPYGDHSPRCAALIQEAGYRGAVSIFSNAPAVASDPFAMRRIYIHPGDTPLRFRFKLSPAYLRYKAYREASRSPVA